MNAELIAVGSELLGTGRIDTNSLFLTAELNALGVEVVTKTIVGDDVARLAEAVRSAAGRSPIVILTGGLGPTEDDVTREAVAQALGRKLVHHPEIVERLERRFRAMNRPMAAINLKQAQVIEGAEVLPNDNGTAPGQWLEDGGRIVALLPGPPAEMEPVFLAECLPRLRRLLPPQAIRRRIYRVADVPESELDQLISPVYGRYSNPATTILAAPGDIQIHLRARAEQADEAERLLEELGSQIEELLGDRIYSRDGSALEEVVGGQLRAARATLSVAESCTGGLLGERITSVAGSSDYFLGGFLTYSNRAKSELLGVPPGLIEEHGAVSEPVAAAMAEGARTRLGATWALAISGVAGPGGGTPAKPVGTVAIALAGPAVAQTTLRRFLGDRQRVRGLAAHNALNMLRRALL